MYRIKFFKKDDPSVKGGGEPVLTKEQAEAWVKASNSQYPFLHHYAEYVEVKEQ